MNSNKCNGCTLQAIAHTMMTKLSISLTIVMSASQYTVTSLCLESNLVAYRYKPAYTGWKYIEAMIQNTNGLQSVFVIYAHAFFVFSQTVFLHCCLLYTSDAADE